MYLYFVYKPKQSINNCKEDIKLNRAEDIVVLETMSSTYWISKQEN